MLLEFIIVLNDPFRCPDAVGVGVSKLWVNGNGVRKRYMERLTICNGGGDFRDDYMETTTTEQQLLVLEERVMSKMTHIEDVWQSKHLYN